MSGIMQPTFLKFHDIVKLLNTEENVTLREKRDAVLKRMRDRGLRFESFNQGSYAMNTGVVPLNRDCDYDIDVGVIFSEGGRPDDPLALKGRVFDAVQGHTSNVEWRRHCIRVQYVKAGEPTYHVDLPVYWGSSGWMGTSLVLAVGKRHSGRDHTEWQPSDPMGFVELVNSHLSGEDRLQFRRVVRYMKRWKDYNFPPSGNAAPVGVGLTVAALNLFAPSRSWGARTPADYDDLTATQNLINRMRRDFTGVWHTGEWASRLVHCLPVQPGRDVFARMTNQQMTEFHQRLGVLASQFEEAQRTGRPDALGRAFGPDFLAACR